MEASYSGHKLIELSILIEEKGYRFYKFLASRAKRDAFIELYNWLADQKKSHITLFEGVRPSFENMIMNGPDHGSKIPTYFQELIDTKVFPDENDRSMLRDEIDDEIGAIQVAISFEKDNILFFQEIQEKISEQDKDIINKLIEGKKAHIRRLLDVKRNMINISD